MSYNGYSLKPAQTRARKPLLERPAASEPAAGPPHCAPWESSPESHRASWTAVPLGDTPVETVPGEPAPVAPQGQRHPQDAVPGHSNNGPGTPHRQERRTGGHGVRDSRETPSAEEGQAGGPQSGSEATPSPPWQVAGGAWLGRLRVERPAGSTPAPCAQEDVEDSVLCAHQGPGAQRTLS